MWQAFVWTGIGVAFGVNFADLRRDERCVTWRHLSSRGIQSLGRRSVGITENRDPKPVCAARDVIR